MIKLQGAVCTLEFLLAIQASAGDVKHLLDKPALIRRDAIASMSILC
jgi:hypothetical protein